MEQFTVTQIADLIARAASVRKSEHEALHTRIRNFARKGLLEGGTTIDKRETQVFPKSEVFRARLLHNLANFGISAPTLRDVAAAGKQRREAGRASEYAPSQQISRNSYRSVGEFFDSLHGVACEEAWSLIVAAYPPLKIELPGFYSGKMTKIRFQWEGAPMDIRNLSRFDEAVPDAVLTVNLTALYKPILGMIGPPNHSVT